MKTQIVCNKISELSGIARLLIEKYPDQRLFAFYGEMGAGKTTFIQYLCDFLGFEETVSSPTFSLVNVYQTKEDETIYHFDFYRIEKLEEVYDMGYEEYFYSGNYCFLEWPEKISQLLPPDVIEVRIEVNHMDEKRFISF